MFLDLSHTIKAEAISQNEVKDLYVKDSLYGINFSSIESGRLVTLIMLLPPYQPILIYK